MINYQSAMVIMPNCELQTSSKSKITARICPPSDTRGSVFESWLMDYNKVADVASISVVQKKLL